MLRDRWCSCFPRIRNLLWPLNERFDFFKPWKISTITRCKKFSKREKKSNLEGGLNKDDKKASQDKQVNTKTLSISKKGRNSELKVDVKSKKTKKDKI